MRPPPAGDLIREERWMRDALAEADKARGRTSPNPLVGALVVKSGRVVGVGHHQRAGTPHAEVHALAAAGERARGADLIVTLEPCNHHGRTPPCTEAILAAGIKRVIIGSRDPNPRVKGGGAKRLRRAGVEVAVGIERESCDLLNEHWLKFITTGRPWVLLKAAVSLDGKLAAASGDSRWVTGPGARQTGHHLRDELDAVMVGLGTALADEPRLTARGRRNDGAPMRDPVRVVVDSAARLPPSARMLRQRSAAATLVAVTARAPARRLRALERAGATIVNCRATPAGLVDLGDLLGRLAERELTSVLVEGGSRLHGSLLAESLWDELYLFLAPKIVGEGAPGWAGFPAVRQMADALPVRWASAEVIPLPPDLLVRARPLR